MKAIIISALTLTLSACGSLPEATQPKQVSLNFSAQINGQAFECGKSYANVGATRSTITPSDFRMYVSEVVAADVKLTTPTDFD